MGSVSAAGVKIGGLLKCWLFNLSLEDLPGQLFLRIQGMYRT